ncbi:Hypothetical protein CINCED_3A021786 [Cinara cedri]|uniref:PHD-type domain-containing protein n=1 Tax=Cinara cedri TaxID=506608 RepID=A0A5E4N8A2_9HEMI|nr:Hypothetical protein CINCED_3A021786 [Cinara cedri]
MDVTTMEPVKLSAIPRDRFNRVCYICEEKNKGTKVTTYGACMSCNKSGCKLGFHVTCAQNAGLLCEEAGNYYDNVKYVGYCKHHYSKLKKSNSIKPIAPYRPQNQSENSSSDFTPEKEPPINVHIDSQNSKPKRKLTIINNFGDKFVNNKKIKDTASRNTLTGDQRKTGPHIVTTHPSGNLVISIGTKTENKSCTSKKQCFDDSETEVKHTARYHKSKNAMSIVKSEDDQSSNDLKVIEEPNLHHVENKSTIIQSSGQAINLSQMTDTNALKKETSVINSPSYNKHVTKTESIDKNIYKNGANAPHMLGNSLNPSSSMAQTMADTLNEEIETHKMFNNEACSLNSAQKNMFAGPQIHRRNPRSSQNQQETSQAQASGPSWSSFTNGINSNSNQALEDLLERQWEQGGAFLMEQAQHFDIASLLTCLYQLKSENVNLEEELDGYTRRRDHLLAVNARLAIPLAPQINRNQPQCPPTTTMNHPEPPVPIQPPMPNYQPNLGNIDSSLQHRYQNHSMFNRHPGHHFPNNVPSQVVNRGSVAQEPRLDNRRQVHQNLGVLNPNPMYQATAQQSHDLSLPHHQMGTDGQPKHS